MQKTHYSNALKSTTIVNNLKCFDAKKRGVLCRQPIRKMYFKLIAKEHYKHIGCVTF